MSDDITGAYIDVCRERDEARAKLDNAEAQLGGWEVLNGVLKIERDEARAAFDNCCEELVRRTQDHDEARSIARRYRRTHRDCAAHRGQRCTMCVAFDALPWAKDDAEP
jgi:hypothetical protein